MNTCPKESPCFAECRRLFPRSDALWPTASELEKLFNTPLALIDDPVPQSVNGGLLQEVGYEGFIEKTRTIPTRHNWHDWFNAFIWSQFPSTKLQLNQWHVKDIKINGLHPRSRYRDRITHWDECGVVLLHTKGCDIPNLLSQHQWYEAFYGNQAQWGINCKAVIFGHAMYESLLNPFIGLTAKFIPIEVSQSIIAEPSSQNLEEIDHRLLKHLSYWQFSTKISPLPVLGVPGWYPNQDKAFYQNTQYFMPKRTQQ